MRYCIKKIKALGFSLVEMVISIAIISIVATTIYGNYPAVNKFVSYATAINDFASQVKQIQIYGASRGGTTAKGDGVYMATNSPAYYYLFNDAITSSSTTTGIGTSNLLWDGTSLEPTTTSMYLNSVTLSRICADNTEYYGVATATPTFVCNLPNLIIVFTRPKLNASISYISYSGVTTTVKQACIEMSQLGVSSTTQQRSIVFDSAGEIIVKKARCI